MMKELINKLGYSDFEVDIDNEGKVKVVSIDFQRMI